MTFTLRDAGIGLEVSDGRCFICLFVHSDCYSFDIRYYYTSARGVLLPLLLLLILLDYETVYLSNRVISLYRCLTFDIRDATIKSWSDFYYSPETDRLQNTPKRNLCQHTARSHMLYMTRIESHILISIDTAHLDLEKLVDKQSV